MNKKFAIIIVAAGMTMSGFAQLSMPYADVADMQPVQEQPQDQNAVPPVQAKHNAPSQSFKEERNDIRRGNSLFNKEKYHEALEEYDKALAVNSGSIRAKYNKAVTLLQLQSEDNKGTENDPRIQASRLFAELIPDAKNYDIGIAEKSFYNLGNVAFNDEQFDQAIDMYKNALRINPDNLQTRENLRLAQLKKEEQEQNQDQNQDQQNQDQQQEQQEQQEQQNQEQNQDQHQQQKPQQQQQQMTQSAQQILQTMQNKENQTRKKVKEEEAPATGRPNPEKPW